MTHHPTILSALLAANCTMAAAAAVASDEYIEPNSPGVGDSFGGSVDAGDTFFVVGAATDDDVATDAGSVTAYFPDIYGPPLSILEAPVSLVAGANFGATVAADGDTFIVAAPAQHDSFGSPVGAVYVYTVGSMTITLQAILQPSTIIPTDLFGQDVDIVGDTIVVGAPGSGGGEGSVFVFNRVAGDWSSGSEVFSNHGADGDGFGWAVSLDQNDESRMMVSAPWDSDSSFESGRVYALEYSFSAWVSTDEIDESDIGTATDRLGIELDFDGDHFAVGEPLNGDGFIHIIGWDGSAGAWGLVETLQPATSANYGLFGESLSLDGELLAVGVRLCDLNGPLSGAGYLFRLVANADWEQLVEVEGDTNGMAYGLGQGVCVDQGIMIMGAPGATTITTSTVQGGLVFGWDVRSTPGCPGDLEMTGVIDANDLMAFLLAWGTCTDPWGCPEDLDDDSEIGVLDLMLLLANWGGC
jgi:hypothetical protein